MADQKFSWPKGCRGAVSLTFDDGRASQLAEGIPCLDSLGVKATFYLNPPKIEPSHIPGWKKALAQGHELGNHTCSHPCSGNFEWSRHNAIEDYDLTRMEAEMLDCNRQVEAFVGRQPRTFAYPCGQAYVGRGLGLQSVVPLVARHFTAGRGYLSEEANDPAYVDLSLLGAEGSDGVAFEALRASADRALSAGRWLVFAGHDISTKPGFQVTHLPELEKLVTYLKDPAQGVWLDTVEAVAGFIQTRRA